MAFTANSTQTRELTELRNHLKWLDEERRKSARKVGELEQRFAQQGRELSDRDRRVQELEWQLNNLAERLDRLPQDNAETTAHEQRIQDLEWHLSNVNAQLVRLPKVDDELATFRGEITNLVEEQRERQSRVESNLEQRLATEQEDLNHNIRQLEERLQIQVQLEAELDAQRDANVETTRQVSELREQLPDSVARLERELIIRVDEEARALANSLSSLTGSLAQMEQQLIFRQAADNQTEEQLEDIRSSLSRVLFIEQDLTNISVRVDEQLSHAALKVEEDLQEMQSRLTRDNEERLGAVETQLASAQQALTRIQDLETELSATSTRVDENLAQATARVDESLVQVTTQVDQSLAQVTTRVDQSLLEATSRAEAEFNQIIQRLTEELDGRLLTISTRIEEVQQTVPPDVRQAITSLERRLEEVRQTVPPDVQDAIVILEQRIEEVRQTVPLDVQRSVVRLEQELELRQAEEVRLSNLIGIQEGKLAPLTDQIQGLHELLSKVEERVGRNGETAEQLRLRLQEIDEGLKPQMTGLGARLEQAAERLGILGNSAARLEGSVKSLSEEQTELRSSVATLNEQISRSDKEVERQLETWRTTSDEQKDTIDRFAQQWTILSNQYKEARMAVQNFAHWQKQLEQQRRESSEMLRVESNRMQGRWDGLLLEINERLKNFEIELEQKWKNFEVDAEQKWSAVRRSEQQWREEFATIDELLVKLQQDNRNLIWRVQAAQADAIKKWPRLWLEEVEKAVELNPNRRLQTSSGSPLRADMSVIDALEQGLIKIDYEEDLDQSLEQ